MATRSGQEEMDLDEWELIPNNSFKNLDLDHNEDHHEAMMNDYFFCTSTQDSLHKTEPLPRSIVVPSKLLQEEMDHENKKIPNDPDLDPVSKPTLSTDSLLSQRVSSFKKLKETEFVDMKIDPPARITSPLPQIDDVKRSDSEGRDDLREKKENDDVSSDHGGEKLNLWKIGVKGIGTICSFGVAAAAATVCVFFLGHNNIKICKNKNQMLRFQIYSDDNKRMEEIVNHATKRNETIFGLKCFPVVRAQLSFGGHYDCL